MVSYAVYMRVLSERQACRTLNISRTAYRYFRNKQDAGEIQGVLQRLADRKPRWGFGKVYDFLRLEGRSWKHKKIRRSYREMNFNPRIKPRKRLPARDPERLFQPQAPI